MATTPNGLPYPLSSASLNQGANDIKALAIALDPRAPNNVMMVNGNYTTNASGDVTIATPGTAARVGIIMYTGPYAPIYGNVVSVSGGSMTVRFNRGTDGSAVASSFLGVMGVIYYT